MQQIRQQPLFSLGQLSSPHPARWPLSRRQDKYRRTPFLATKWGDLREKDRLEDQCEPARPSQLISALGLGVRVTYGPFDDSVRCDPALDVYKKRAASCKSEHAARLLV